MAWLLEISSISLFDIDTYESPKPNDLDIKNMKFLFWFINETFK